MALNDAMFEQVPLNSSQPNACSPAEPPLSWRGLLIQAPSQVRAQTGRRFALPVCGYYRLDTEKLLDSAPLTLVAIDVRSKARYSGPVLDEDPGLMAENPDQRPLDRSRLKGMFSGAYFNPDLTRYVALPAAAAVYSVHAEYGGMVSNSVQISVGAR